MRKGTPKQSVYLALRKLKAKEVIAISKKEVSLHQSWVLQMKKFFTEADTQAYHSKENSILDLEEKEYVTYYFNSLESLDMYWGHACMLLLKAQPKDRPILLYNPHEWFFIARERSEYGILKEAVRRNIAWMHLIGGKKPLDEYVRKFFDGVHARCHLAGKDVWPNNHYVNSFGDIVIEVWIDEKLAKAIDDIYKTYNHVDDRVIGMMRKLIIERGGKHKMKISRNAVKAKKIRSVFSKYFIIS